MITPKIPLPSNPFKFVKKQKQEIGISPDELLFRGIRKSDKVHLRIIDFDDQQLEEKSIENIDEAFPLSDTATVTWLNIDGLHEAQIMDKIHKGLNLPKLVLSNVMDTQARPTVQDHENSLFISLKMLQRNPETDLITIENLSMVIMDHMLISFQEKKGDVFDPVRERIRMNRKRIRNSGTDYLAFTLLDIVIDNYIYNLGILGEKIEDLEDRLLVNQNKKTIDLINRYKRELNFMRKSIKPAKEMILALAKLDTDFIHEENEIYFRELQENISHASETSDNYREMLSDQLNIYHTTISSKLNDIMKFLTIFSVIFIPLTFIAGIYGTNFDVLPELHYRYSYYIMWLVMIVITIAMLVYFKKKKWF
ncbi:magnesium/cobalt transporter CorA [Echinicola marina]|uniref:magnesium/cobalt transporter CorA n=1 Tax=Echinicola marina TaxID=2859768 RepID=UPI001CF6C89C|nr:magnesium/cobalt transporter CorA [Echinicola marina]UCS92019.1 magnesium/cobalt transporter CorA [Echinicola marina]